MEIEVYYTKNSSGDIVAWIEVKLAGDYVSRRIFAADESCNFDSDDKEFMLDAKNSYSHKAQSVFKTGFEAEQGVDKFIKKIKTVLNKWRSISTPKSITFII